MSRRNEITDIAEDALDRRAFLARGGAALGGIAFTALARPGGASARGGEDDVPKATEFPIACMTLPYSRFPLERALRGIRSAGYRYVAWGTRHEEDGGRRPLPLACENIFAPLLPRPDRPEGVDALARRARGFLEIVIGGLQRLRKSR